MSVHPEKFRVTVERVNKVGVQMHTDTLAVFEQDERGQITVPYNVVAPHCAADILMRSLFAAVHQTHVDFHVELEAEEAVQHFSAPVNETPDDEPDDGTDYEDKEGSGA